MVKGNPIINASPKVESKSVYLTCKDGPTGSTKVNHSAANVSQGSVVLRNPQVRFMSDRDTGSNSINPGCKHNATPVEVIIIFDKMAVRILPFWVLGKQIPECYITEIGEVAGQIQVVRQTTLRNVIVQKISYRFSKGWQSQFAEATVAVIEFLPQETEVKRHVYDSDLVQQGFTVAGQNTARRETKV